MTTRAALYHRVSTEEQAKEGYSLADQQDATRKYAESKNYKVVDEYTDPGNASRDTINRPQLQRLLADAKAGKLDVVVVLHPDRLGSDRAFHTICYMLENDSGVRIEYLLVEYRDEYATLIQSLDAWKAGEELTSLHRRTHAGRVRKAKEGKAASMPTPLYGYKYNVLTKEHEVDEEQARIVIRVIDEYAQGRLPAEIAASLNREGIETALQSNGRRETKGWTADRVRRLVNQEAYYTGARIANRFYGAKQREREKLSRNAQRPKSDWVEIPRAYPPIATEELWHRVQAQRVASRTRAKYNRASPRWLLAGKLECTECGQKFASKQGNPNQKKRLANGEIREYQRRQSHRYYKCYGIIHYPHLHNCRTPKSIPAEKLEAMIWQQVSKALQNPHILFDAVNEKCEIYERQMDAMVEHIEHTKAKITELKEEQSRNYRAHLKAIVPEALYEHEADRIQKELDQLEEQLEIDKHFLGQLLDEAEVGQELEQAVHALEAKYASIQEWSDDDKQEAIQQFVTKITIDRDGQARTYLELPHWQVLVTKTQPMGRPVATPAQMEMGHPNYGRPQDTANRGGRIGYGPSRQGCRARC